MPGGVNRLIFVNPAQGDINNRYIPGSGVAINRSRAVRRHLYKKARATNTCCSKAVPGPPENVTASPGPISGSINISWEEPTTDGGSPILSYTVVSVQGEISVTVTGSERRALITGLTNGTPYIFYVYATNAVGNSNNAYTSSPITPVTLPTASVWFDPSNPSYVTLSSNRVIALTDLTTNGYNGTYINSFIPGPTYIAPQFNVDSINGLSTFRIDNSTSDVQTINVPGYNFNDVAISYAMVVRYISGQSGFMTTDTPGLFGRGIGCDAGNLVTISYNAFTTWDGTPAPNIQIPINTPSILIASISAGNWIFSLNGTQYTLPLVQAKLPDNTNGLNIGCWNPLNSASIVFDCGEVLAYTSFLSNTQIQTLEGYLGAKWGLLNSLPLSHPYYKV